MDKSNELFGELYDKLYDELYELSRTIADSRNWRLATRQTRLHGGNCQWLNERPKN
ncbi:hypothetical protein [Endozoicomonas sp. ONNA2]|uniref:hypothetical protein n=1 Tax=Endozoicomonas sp. ONNA2 TaxID=2828741 RepID=UPI0021495163|nr:hypothetical protein [Endozoicomonas sp. ONNA2]